MPVCTVLFVLSRPRVQKAYLRNYGTLTRISGVLVGVFGVKLIVTAVREVRGG